MKAQESKLGKYFLVYWFWNSIKWWPFPIKYKRDSLVNIHWSLLLHLLQKHPKLTKQSKSSDFDVIFGDLE